jgi:ubiquinone/menaquinone biosynthesis C-methylase UbiE
VSVDYSRLARDYDDVRADEAVDRAFWFAALMDVGHLRHDERILDLGAGTGRFSRFALEFARVVAVDISPAMLSEARAKGTPNLIRADACALPFCQDAFDATLLVMVLHQVDDYRRALRETARVSRRAVIATSDMRMRSLGILEEAFPSLLAIDRARFPPIEELVAALKEVGFPHVDIEARPLRRTFPVAWELERVRRKYISTLDMLPPGEFERGVAFLERELPRRYRDTFETSANFTFVGASR